jgi:hypothetical protein
MIEGIAGLFLFFAADATAAQPEMKSLLNAFSGSLPAEALRVIQSSPAVIPGTIKLAVAVQCTYMTTEWESCGRIQRDFELGSAAFRVDGKDAKISIPQLPLSFELNAGVKESETQLSVQMAVPFEMKMDGIDGRIPFGVKLLDFPLNQRTAAVATFDDELRKQLQTIEVTLSETGAPQGNKL